MTMLFGGPALLPVLCILGLHCVEGQPQQGSICHTQAYRQLSPQLQNEHQCMVLENLQADIQQGEVNQAEQLDNLFRMMSRLNDGMRRGFFSLTRSSTRDQIRSRPALSDIPIVRDCQELQQTGTNVSGIYPIQLPTRRLVNVRCDMDTSKGGWTVIQRRIDGTINFTRTWVDYAFGFGNVNTEYWLGNEHLHRMTTTQKYSIRIDLWDWEDNYVFAQYDNFRVDHEHSLYQLHIQNYTGTAGDAMGSYHDGMRFSTVNSDNDQWHSSCAQSVQSGWWFRGCGHASLNGLYTDNEPVVMYPDGTLQGLVWYDKGNDIKYSLKKTEMKIKPLTSVLYEREQEALLELTTAIPTTTPTPTTTTTVATTPTTMASTSTTEARTAAIPDTTTDNPTPTPPTTTTIASTITSIIEEELEDREEEVPNDINEEIAILEAIKYKLQQKIERFKILNKKEAKDNS